MKVIVFFVILILGLSISGLILYMIEYKTFKVSEIEHSLSDEIFHYAESDPEMKILLNKYLKKLPKIKMKILMWSYVCARPLKFIFSNLPK